MKKGDDLSAIVINDYLNNRFFMIDNGVDEIQSLFDFKLTHAMKIKSNLGAKMSTNYQSPVIIMKTQYLDSPAKKPQ